MRNMADVMDDLIMKHKNPVYLENLYKLTPQPAFLKHDINWDTPISEDLKCPYCCELNNKNFYENANVFIYISPKGYLIISDSDGIDKISIMFCPMCGRQLK